jgi:hypothetical protein
MRQHIGVAGVSSRLLAAAVVLLFAVAPAHAQGTTFNPWISIGYTYTDNVDYLNPSGTKTGDYAATGAVVLPLVRRSERGSLRLTYGASTVAYQEESQFDNTEHRVSFDVYRENRRRSSWRVSTNYVKTDEQQTSPILPAEIVPGESEDPDDANLSLTSRTDRETIDAAFDYGWRIGRRWGLNAGLRAGETRVDGGTDVEDRTWYGPSVRLRNTFSRRTSLGVGYHYQKIELEVSGDEDFHALEFFLERGLSRKLQLELHVGGMKRDTETLGSDTLVFGTANVRFNHGLTLGPVRLDFLAGVSPARAEALAGTALNSTAGFSISGVRVRPVNWRIGTTYNHRSPFESGEATSETFRVRAGVEPRISKLLGIRFAASYSDQTSEDTALEASHTRVGVTLVVYPLSGKRIADWRRGA